MSMNLAPTTWAWVRRITEIAPTVLWALAATGAAIMIMYFPRILEARATIERQRAQEITEENRAYWRRLWIECRAIRNFPAFIKASWRPRYCWAQVPQ